MKISVTLLDSYRYWRETEFMDEDRERNALEELIAKIKGQRTPFSEPALRGIAFANILEEPEKYFHEPSNLYRADGFEFDVGSVKEFMLMIPDDALKEVWLPHYHHRDSYLVGRADNIVGILPGDVKLITKKFNAKKYQSYEDSIQWQAYCLMSDCPEFQYYIAQAKISKKDDIITVCNFETFKLYRSDVTDERVKKLMRDFTAFAKPYLPAAA